MSWSDVDWGSAPAWVSFAAALAAATIAFNNLRLDRMDRRQAFASKVAAWPGPNFHPRKDDDEFCYQEVGVWLLNASEAPVYDMKIELHISSTPDGEVIRVDKPEPLPVLPPAKEPRFLSAPYQGPMAIVPKSRAFALAGILDDYFIPRCSQSGVAARYRRTPRHFKAKENLTRKALCTWVVKPRCCLCRLVCDRHEPTH